MKRILLTCFVLMAMVVSTSAWAQDRTVTGRVTGADDGLPLPQVTVLLKGTTTGTPTDADGNYRLAIPQGEAVLIFRYLGYVTQEVDVQNQSIINIQLSPDATSLGEVVVTGYGVEKKRDITGSVGQVKAEEIAGLPVQSFDRAIQGRIAGVQVQTASGQPGAFASVLIRGQGSLTSNTPLYIVDGVQMITGGTGSQASSNALAGLNPEDIESIEVLKDAGAAAIYGAQSANGVVIITTKKGSKGGEQAKVELSYQIGVNQPRNLYDVMNAQQFAEIREEAFANAGRDVSIAHGAFGDPSNPATINNFDWVDAMYQDGVVQQVSARISGGSDKSSFFISASQENQEGHIILSTYDRTTFRLNVSHRPNDRLSVGANMGVTRQKSFGTIAGGFVNSPLFAAYVAQPNSPGFTESGEFNLYPAHRLTSGRGHLVNYNILQGVDQEIREQTSATIIANLNLNYKILDKLSFNVVGGINYLDGQSENNRPQSIPVFSGFGGSVFIGNFRQLNWNTNATLNGNTTFGDHTLSGVLGVEFVRSDFEDQNASVRGFANAAQRSLDDGATFFNINGSRTYNTRAGAFARVNYKYKDKYNFSGTFRRDGSSRFGAQNRVGTFFSTGVSWVAKEEAFLKDVSWLSDLKVRGSYGELGNSNGINNFEAVPSFSGSGQYLGGPGQVLNLANDLLTWEKSVQLNFGIDYALFNNKISGSIDLFQNDTEAQLFNTPLPIESGFTTIRANTGSVRNSGVEIELQSTNIDAGELRWTSNFNITFLKNEVLELPGGVSEIGLGTNNALIVGESTQFIWGVDYAGVNPASGRPLWRDANGDLVYGNVDAQTGAYIIGKSNPDAFGGLSNTLSYKGLSLDVFFQFQVGLEAYNSDLPSYADSGSSDNNQLVTQLNRWQQPGDVTNVPIAYEGGQVDGFDLTGPGVISGRYISDGSYVRLKQVTLAYDLPNAVVSRMGMNSVNVFLQALNLATITNFDGIDPEVISRQNSVGGSATGAFPVGRQFTLGINIGF